MAKDCCKDFHTKIYRENMNDGTKKNTILIVDDSPENISLISSLLKGMYKIKIAINGRKALQIASSNDPPDLILLDVMMPEMDGYETCRYLKSDPKTNSIPIIFLTSKDQTEDEKMGLELGAVDYITKPVSPPIVCARVKNHIELSRAYKYLKSQAECLKEQAECLKDQTEQLEIQNKELIETARLREDIERIMRHDLKSPLNGIINFPELIKLEGGLNEKQTKYLQKVVEGGYKILNMINLSLDILKMERGIYPFEPEPVNILAVMENITRELQNYIKIKKLAISITLNGIKVDRWFSFSKINSFMADKIDDFEIDNSKNVVFFVQGEELLCYLMLSNLIKNAIEASPQYGIIDVHLEEFGQKAMIRIHNQGAVPKNIRDRFFKKYVTSGKRNGTGLGAYSAKLIALTQNGEISMNTSEDDGTSITIYLNRE